MTAISPRPRVIDCAAPAAPAAPAGPDGPDGLD